MVGDCASCLLFYGAIDHSYESLKNKMEALNHFHSKFILQLRSHIIDIL